MLGLEQVIVVLNKMDLLNFDYVKFERIKSEIIIFLDKLRITPKYIIPISAIKGDNIAKISKNIPWYKDLTVLQALDKFSVIKVSEKKPLRYPIQDVYKIENKRILVGRVESGQIIKGEKVHFLPSGKESQIKTVEIWNQKKNKAGPGESIGITITDPLFVERGEILANLSNLPKVKNEVLTNIFWMAKEPINKNQKIILKCATQETECEIIKINNKIDSSTLEDIKDNSDRLNETEVGNVLIKTDKPIVVENFNYIEELGRFVLVRDDDTVAGGIIVE
jgi:sulfate adenylyltransferase subunit 1 (EFTu-like GTPase family)